MLEVKNISKTYDTGTLKQTALDDVSISFRKCEFVSILGPSGSGKTTLLNIIGGLDHYDKGDLLIENISTKKYKDRDWDSYRNHRIGFIFQSYNLIGHQTILANVKLALTLSGITNKEATSLAKEALTKVGLEKHIYKKPNQLSGGQMQRVAIARALVNNPEIILADEPTGALDSETSVQIMNILKDIAKDRLVVMVTHNPELANVYSNRIVTLKDGKVTGDTNPYNPKKEKEAKSEKTKKTKMSLKTAIGLSLNNLLTKKGRTVLVAFAGSIGIIGIALILAVSTGFQNYVDSIQESTLTSYPFTVNSEAADLTSLLLTMSEASEGSKATGKVVEQQNFSKMFSTIKSNDIKSFKKYLEENYDDVKDDLAAMQYNYSIDPLIYTYDATGKIAKLNPNSMFTSLYGNNGMMSSFSNMSSVFQRMNSDTKTLSEQYDVLAGTWPEKYNEVIIVLHDPNEINELLVYSLGLRDPDELTEGMKIMMSGGVLPITSEPMEFTYEELMNVKLKLVMNSDLYKYNSKYDVYEDMSEDKAYMKELYKNSEDLKIVGIVCPKEGISSTALMQGINFRGDLIDHIIEYNKNSDAVKKQLKNADIDVFSGNKFNTKNNYDFSFADLVKVDNKKLQSAFSMKVSEEDIKKATTNYMNSISSSINVDVAPVREEFVNLFNELNDDFNNSYNHDLSTLNVTINNVLNKQDNINKLNELTKKYYIPVNTFKQVYTGLIASFATGANMNNATVVATINQMVNGMLEAKVKSEVLTKVGELTGYISKSLAAGMNIDANKITSAFTLNFSEDELTRVVSAMMTKQDNTQKSNLLALGYQDIEDPTFISFYFNSFDGKEHFLNYIDEYNKKVPEESQIKYTDTTGILMGSVKTIVNAVSYVLIAFVSISLVVSSIMIGVITYISVYERTKEIGILRAMGASKHNISSIFNAETFIIGFLSGLFGIGISYGLIPIINAILHHYTGNIPLSASLNISSAAILVVISIILTLIGGLIPAKKASKKDPVIALRTE